MKEEPEEQIKAEERRNNTRLLSRLVLQKTQNIVLQCKQSQTHSAFLLAPRQRQDASPSPQLGVFARRQMCFLRLSEMFGRRQRVFDRPRLLHDSSIEAEAFHKKCSRHGVVVRRPHTKRCPRRVPVELGPEEPVQMRPRLL